MKTHTVIGETLCSGLKSFRQTVQIIRSHHERWDGSGYPDGLKGEDIPLLARIFQICDIYDALSYARPYKSALPTTEVIRIIHEETERGWRDPALVRVFLALVENEADAFLARGDRGEDLGRELYEGIKRTQEDLDLLSPQPRVA
jgi:putative two-component system response regulator